MGGTHASDSMLEDVGDQVRRRWAPVVVLLLLGAVAALGLALLGRREGVELADLSRDPAAVAGLPVYVGALAYLAFIGWAVGFAGAVTGVLVARRLADRRRALMLGFAAALSLWLLLDDMFEFHESVGPRLGVPERITYLSYVVALIAWLWFFRTEVRDSDWLVLVLGLGFLASSAVLDELNHGSNSEAYLEDIFKMLGTWLWGAYFVLTAAHDIPTAVPARAADEVVTLPEDVASRS
jgi:hypothetical protein